MKTDKKYKELRRLLYTNVRPSSLCRHIIEMEFSSPYQELWDLALDNLEEGDIAEASACLLDLSEHIIEDLCYLSRDVSKSSLADLIDSVDTLREGESPRLDF